jgi:hypothetical protein
MRPSAVTRRALRLVTVLALLAGGCIARPEPTESVPPARIPAATSTPDLPTSTPTMTVAPPPPSIAPSATPVPSLPPLVDACPPRPFDDSVVLGPPFDQETFVADESRTIAEQLVFGLERIYADPRAVDPCDLFTDRGFATALRLDPRLFNAVTGQATTKADLVFRARNESEYDLRRSPPRVPIDAIFDIAAGAVTTPVATGESRRSQSAERIGFHFVLEYDGHRWRIDDVGPVDADFAEQTRIPGPVVPGPPCTGFRRDPPGTPFDERASRVWCDDGGRGRVIVRHEQLDILTKYPCGAHSAVLIIGRPVGAGLDPLVRWEYVRDPGNVFWDNRWVRQHWVGDTRLPKDAVDTGWTNGNIDLWVDPAELDRAIHVVRGGTVERWPRATDFWGVTDCN